MTSADGKSSAGGPLGRVRQLITFLLFERRNRSIRDHERLDLECVLIVSAFAIMGLLFAVRHQADVYLNLFFLPVSISAFYLGRYRAGLSAGFCVLCAIYVIWTRPDFEIGLLAFCTWCGVLTLSALFIGTLSDELNSRFDRAIEHHASETRTDALTCVANRRSFDIELQSQLGKLHEEGTPFCLAFVDIDYFKRFNDTYGHQAGDKVLHDVARSLETTVRQSDVVYRYGGEEFAVLMPNVKIEDCLNVTERVRRDIEATRFFHNRAKLRLTVSVGVSTAEFGDSEATIVKRADEALYASKQAGRNCVHYDLGAGCEHYGAPLPAIEEADSKGETEVVEGASFEDHMTGLATRRVFLSELSRRISESARYGSTFSIIMLRLPTLPDIEAKGESAVNHALTIVSEQTRNVMRDTDLIARYARDCFAVLMPCTTIDQAITPVERLLKEIEECESLRYRGESIQLKAEAGIAEPSRGDESASCLIDRALTQMSASGLQTSDFPSSKLETKTEDAATGGLQT